MSCRWALSPRSKESGVRTSIGTGIVLAAALLAAGTVAGCSTAGGATDPGGSATLQVVAAEKVWASIARQLGGSRVSVTNLIDSPDAAPHDYEPTPADARAVAGADLVLINGVGYDTWAGKLVEADPAPRRLVLTVGELV